MTARDQLVLWSIRIPRIAIAAMVGALLAVSGAIMQGLFRNPLADPALVGVSSGGAFAAASASSSPTASSAKASASCDELLPLAAFAGSLVTTCPYRIASRAGRTSIAIFLFGGLAIAALANAGIGLLIFIADDRQLRDITFWLLGRSAARTGPRTPGSAPVLLVGARAACPFIARSCLLTCSVLGESRRVPRAGSMSERLKRISIVLVAAMTGAARLSVCGGHWIRRHRPCRTC